MSSDPKQNSRVGVFNQTSNQGKRESFDLISPLPVSIEGFETQNAGNNCIFQTKPHIINATNIDTDSIIGEAGIQSSLSKLTALVQNIMEETIAYTGYGSDNLPACDTKTWYHIFNVMIITAAHNAESLADVNGAADGVFLGMEAMAPSRLNIAINSRSRSLIPIMSYPGIIKTILLTSNEGVFPSYETLEARTVMAIGFPIVVLSDDQNLSLSLSSSLFSFEPASIENVASIAINLIDFQQVIETDIVVYPIEADVASGTYSVRTLDIQCSSYTPGYPVNYEVKDMADEIVDSGIVTGPITITSSSKIIFSQFINNVTYYSDEYEYVIDIVPAQTPTITGGDGTAPDTLTLHYGVGADATELAATSIYYYIDNGINEFGQDRMLYTAPIEIAEGPTNVRVQVETTDPETVGAYYAPSEFVDWYVGTVDTLDDPIIEPVAGTYVNLPRIYVLCSNLFIHYLIRYAWVSLTEDIDNLADGEFETIATNLSRVQIPTLGHSLDKPRLAVFLQSANWTDSARVSATYTITTDDTGGTRKSILEIPDIDIEDDGFDNKLSRKRIEMIKCTPGYMNISFFSVDIDTITEPAVSANYEDTDTIAQMLSDHNLPKYSQSFLATPSRGNTDLSEVMDLYSAQIEIPAIYRKQTIPVSGTDTETNDEYTDKTSIVIYSDSLQSIILNKYSSGTMYNYCFSVVVFDSTVGYETSPNNFANVSSATCDIEISRIQILSNIDSGIMTAIITYTKNDIDYITYLELSHIRNSYPRLAGMRSHNYVLSETTVPSEGYANQVNIIDYKASMLCQARLYSGILAGYPVYSNGSFRYEIQNSISNAAKIFMAKLLTGNNLALIPDAQNAALPITLADGTPQFIGIPNSLSSAVLTWKDGLERYAEVQTYPITLPIMFPYPTSDNGYTIKVNLDRDTWSPDLFALFGDFSGSVPADVTQAILLTKYAFQAIMNAAISTVDSVTTVTPRYMMATDAKPFLGTMCVINPPAIEPGGAYLSVGNTQTDLNMDTIATRILYGDYVAKNALHTLTGIYQSSKWPYMASADKRVSAFGLTSESLLLENYAFTLENGYVCVYFINEQQGKVLMFNELGSLVKYPIIFKGSPYFAINTGTKITLYRGSQEGVFPVRYWNATDALMLNRAGDDPNILIRIANFQDAFIGYDLYKISSMAVYFNSTIRGTFNNPIGECVIRRILTPNDSNYKLISGDTEYEIEYIANDSMTIEASEVYPSILSYEYEQYTFVVNAMVIRFNTTGYTGQKRFDLTVKYNGTTQLCDYKNLICEAETKVFLDATPIKCLSYIITSKAPIRAIRYLGYFIEDLKV